MLLLAILACQPSPPPERAPTVDATGPVIEVAERSLRASQGGTLAVFVRTDEAARIELAFLDRDRTVYPVGDQLGRALIGVPIRAEPGPEPLRIAATDAWGNRTEVVVDVQVAAVDWPETGKLPMSRARARVEPEGVARMREERDAVYATATPTALWAGPMRIPVEGGTRTSEFGSFREYPDGSRNHHDALDLARRRGVPITAAAAGRVALAKRQEMHGNAVLVDHGQKVVGLYSHLDTLAVEPGQTVAPGDLLGTMGSTGRTTGPHLHWGIVVDEVAVDPVAWTHEAFEPDPDDVFRTLAVDQTSRR